MKVFQKNIDNVQIEKMFYTDTNLYVLDKSNNHHIINIDSLEEIQ